MKKHFVARSFDGEVLLAGIKESDGIYVTYASSELGDPEFSSVDAIFMHPKVAYIETLQQIQEDVLMTGSVRGVELTRAESVIFDVLNKKRGAFVPQVLLWEALGTIGRADRKSLRTLVSRLRKKLVSTGLTIGTSWKRGYKLEM